MSHPSLNTGRRRALRLCFGALLFGTGAAALAAPIRVKDARGKLLSLPGPPRRIVSIAPNNTEILFALGLGNRIVGVTDYCDYPAAAKRKPKVGGVVLNLEKIVSLKPDLVVGKYDLQKTSIAQLEKLGVRVFAIDPRTVEETLSAIESVGRATGTEAKARSIAAGMRRELAAVKRVAARDGRRPRVLSVIQAKPLIVTGPKTFLDDALRLAGGVNVADDARQPYPAFSLETAIARKPDVILLSSSSPQAFYGDPAWRTTPAARNRRVYAPAFLPVLERPGPRIVHATLQLAELLHPAR